MDGVKAAALLVAANESERLGTRWQISLASGGAQRLDRGAACSRSRSLPLLSWRGVHRGARPCAAAAGRACCTRPNAVRTTQRRLACWVPARPSA